MGLCIQSSVTNWKIYFFPVKLGCLKKILEIILCWQFIGICLNKNQIQLFTSKFVKTMNLRTFCIPFDFQNIYPRFGQSINNLQPVFELNQMTSDKIMDGRVDFEVKLFIHFMKIS